jgi:hypothetical protein
MPVNPSYSKNTPAEWTGAQALMQTWLGRRCTTQAFLNLIGGGFFLILGVLAMLVTSCAVAAVAFVVLIEANGLLALFGVTISLLRPVLFEFLFLIFLLLTIVHAIITRRDIDDPAMVDLNLSGGFDFFWEFISAGPVLLVMSGQEFHRHYRLMRLDLPQVSALLLWIFDKGGRASFAEICLAFPKLNAVRVLPQLRDLPGINWWPKEAEITFSEELMKNLVETLHREPKERPFAHTYTYTRERSQTTVDTVDPEIRSWYDTLDLPLFATLQEVKKRYRKLAKIYHPDAQAANRVANKIPNDDRMKSINDAYHNILHHSQNNAGAAR